MADKKGRITSFSVVVLFFFLYPIMNAYIRVMGQQVRLLLIIAVILLLALLNKGKVIRKRREKSIRCTMIVWVSLLFIVAMIHQDILIDTQRFLVWMFLPPLIIPAINSKERFLKLITVVVVAGGITACFGIIEEVTHVNVFQLLNEDAADLLSTNMRMGILRIQSFTSHPITYCAYCMFILSLNFYLCSLPENKNAKYLKITYVLVLCGAVLTLSRSALIAIIASQFMLLWLCGYRVLIKRIIQVCIVIGIVLVVVSMVFPVTMEYIQIPFLLVMAVFSDSSAETLRSLGYGGDTSGVAERFILWQWVWEDTRNCLLLGHGPSAWLNRTFVNSGGYVQSKSSIEVQLLIQFFRYGIIAAISELVFYISIFNSAFRARKTKKEWEGKLSFSKMFLALFLCYFVVLFAVTQNETIQVLFITVMLYLSYICNNIDTYNAR